MFRTAVPSVHAAQPKVPLQYNLSGGKDHFDPSAVTVYNLTYQNTQPYSGKPCDMDQLAGSVPTLATPTALALGALRSANDMWIARGSQQQACSHPTARDEIVCSQPQTTCGRSVVGCEENPHSTTSQNQSVCITEESSPISHDQYEDGSSSSMHSTEKAKPRNDIIHDLERILKRGRRRMLDYHSDDAVSESGVFTAAEYSDGCEDQEHHVEQQEDFKLYPDHEDHEALAQQLFRQEDEESVIERVFFAERRTQGGGGS